MELKSFFHQQHKLHNVEVLGLPTKLEDTLSSLLKAPRQLDGGQAKDHQQWSKDLEHSSMYHRYSTERCGEDEMEEWLRKRRREFL